MDDAQFAQLKTRLLAYKEQNGSAFKYTPSAASVSPSDPSLSVKFQDFIPNPPVQAGDDFLKGVVKGAASTAKGTYDLLKKVPGVGGALDAIGPSQKTLQTMDEQTKATTPAQAIGKAGEQIAEFFTPTGLEEFGAKALTKLVPEGGTILAKTMSVVGRMAGNAADFAGKTAVQTGGDAGQTKKAGVIGAVTPPIAGALESGITKFLSSPKVGDFFANVVGEMTGKSPKAVKIAFQNPEAVAKGIAAGVTPAEIRDKAVSALNDFTKSVGDEFKSGLDETKKLYPFGATGKILTKKEIENETAGLPAVLRKFRISVSGDGTLNFDKLNSAIVSPSERKNIQLAYDTINKLKNYSVQGVEDALARLTKLTKFTEGAQTTASAAATAMKSMFADATAKSYPELAKIRATYAAGQGIADGIDDLLRSGKDATRDPRAVTAVIRNLDNIFKDNSEAYINALQHLEAVSGKDFINQLASSQFRDVYSKSLGSTLFQASALAGGIFLHNPLLLAVLPLFSPNVMGKLVTGAAEVAPKLPAIAEKTVESLSQAGTSLSNKKK